MDGVSLAESLLYKDYDELQRLMKGCSITGNQNLCRSSIATQFHDKNGNYDHNCEIPSYKYAQPQLKEDYDLQTLYDSFVKESMNYEERIKAKKSLLGEPVQRNPVSDLLLFKHLSFTGNSHYPCKADQTFSNSETGTKLLASFQKSTDSQPLHNSSSLDPYSPQQTMVSTFKLNAELPVVTTSWTKHNLCGDNSLLPNQSNTCYNCSSHKKALVNESVATLSNREAQFLSNQSKYIDKVSMNNDQTMSGMDPLMYYTNHSNLETFARKTKPNIVNIDELFSSNNSVKAIIPNLWNSNNRTLPKFSSNRDQINNLMHKVNFSNTQYLLPNPSVHNNYAMELQKQEMRNLPVGHVFEDTSELGRISKNINCNTDEGFTNSEALVSSVNTSTQSNMQTLFDASKGNKSSLKPTQSVNNSTGRNFLLKNLNHDGISLKKSSGSPFLYEKMCEQHYYLRNDLEKITSSLASNVPKLEECTAQFTASQNDFESELITLCHSYEKARNLIARLSKLRPGTIPTVIVASLESLLAGIRKLQLHACVLSNSTARDARDRLAEADIGKPRLDFSNIGQTLLELTSQLRQLRTALWACVQRLGWTGTSSYTQAVYVLAELANRGTLVRNVSNAISSNLLHTSSLGNVSSQFKSTARPLMELQTPLDVTHYPTAAVASASCNNSNSTTNPRGLVLIPGAAGTTNLGWSPRNLVTTPSSASRAMFTQPVRYVSDQMVIPDASMLQTGQVGSIYSHGFIFPHTNTHPGQSALIMPSSLLTTNLGCSTNLTPHMCNLQSGTRLTDHL